MSKILGYKHDLSSVDILIVLQLYGLTQIVAILERILKRNCLKYPKSLFAMYYLFHMKFNSIK